MLNDFDVIELPLINVPIWSLKTAEPYVNLFPIQEQTLADIIEDMSINGFDAGHPIVVWNMIVIDGHTRLRAAQACDLETVPVVCRQFVDEESALSYAIRCQSHRRNLTDYELLMCLEKLDWRKRAGRPAVVSEQKRGKSAEIVASTLGVSRTQVERLRVIMDHGTEDIKDAIRKGEISIFRAYEETMRLRRPQIQNAPDPDAELIHRVMADIHAQLNTSQIGKLVKALRLELATN